MKKITTSVGQEIQFINNTDTGGYSPTSFEWDFGDTVKDAANWDPVHKYLGRGTYLVNFTATTAYGTCVDRMQVVVNGVEPTPPTPSEGTSSMMLLAIPVVGYIAYKLLGEK